MTAPIYPGTLGVLLAGGLARRMGGGDKSLQEIAGQSIIARVAGRLAPQCDGLIVNANGDASRFAFLGLPVVPDDIPGFAGPLAGILAALEWTARQRPEIDWLLSAPTDAPFLPRDLLSRLHEAREAAGARLACTRSGERSHPVIGLWPIALRGELRHALVEDGERKVGRWSARYEVATASWPVEPHDPFFNVNTPEELAQARMIAERDPSA